VRGFNQTQVKTKVARKSFNEKGVEKPSFIKMVQRDGFSMGRRKSVLSFDEVQCSEAGIKMTV
jgi:hypothetical protein